MLQVPLPSYKITPPDAELTDKLGCEVELKALLVDEDLIGSAAQVCEGVAWVGTELRIQVAQRYFNWTANGKYLQRQIRTTEGVAYLQTGWLDSVGLYKHAAGLTSHLRSWETDTSKCVVQLLMSA